MLKLKFIHQNNNNNNGKPITRVRKWINNERQELDGTENNVISVLLLTIGHSDSAKVLGLMEGLILVGIGHEESNDVGAD